MQRFFLWNIKSPRWLSPPLQPRFGTQQLLAFPKTKITFDREVISDLWWNSGKYDEAANGNWENCVGSQGAYFEGDWGIIVLHTMVLVSFSINASIFHVTWLDTFWTDLIYSLGSWKTWPRFQSHFQVAVTWPLPVYRRNHSGVKQSLSRKARRMHFLVLSIEPLWVWPPPLLGRLQTVDGNNSCL